MDAVYLTLFVSSVLAVLGVVLFVWTHREGSRDHTHRLALMPLEDDTRTPSAAPLPPENPAKDRP
ncbi:MAG: cbb3-type cytochrome oxidase assembly protein [Deltaproteobacteria bacterium]|nr:cbb3-type cytochrome oxidase assembly protein [Deltaproteobacteria bacterium]